ncbi:putative Ig domain-containing protein, partial [Massilibacteroides sp.]|uniref:putative Ig domain-containing protein n=1 Tax=Massilibacteroides sp. TaxID=2034766 RepID=UPI0026134D0D
IASAPSAERTITITAQDAKENSAEIEIETARIRGAIIIENPSPYYKFKEYVLGSGDQDYSFTINTITGTGTPPYSWSISQGSLPIGISMNWNSINGYLTFSGTPKAAADASSVELTISDFYGATNKINIPIGKIYNSLEWNSKFLGWNFEHDLSSWWSNQPIVKINRSFADPQINYKYAVELEIHRSAAQSGSEYNAQFRYDFTEPVDFTSYESLTFKWKNTTAADMIRLFVAEKVGETLVFASEQRLAEGASFMTDYQDFTLTIPSDWKKPISRFLIQIGTYHALPVDGMVYLSELKFTGVANKITIPESNGDQVIGPIKIGTIFGGKSPYTLSAPGLPPYLFSITGPTTSPSLSTIGRPVTKTAMSARTISGYVTDSLGVSATVPIEIGKINAGLTLEALNSFKDIPLVKNHSYVSTNGTSSGAGVRILQASGGSPPYTYDLCDSIDDPIVTDRAICPGIILSADGLVKGRPTEAVNQTNYGGRLRVTDSLGYSAIYSDEWWSPTVSEMLQKTMSSYTLSPTLVNTNFESEPLFTGGGSDVTTFYSGLPSGITLSNRTSGWYLKGILQEVSSTPTVGLISIQLNSNQYTGSLNLSMSVTFEKIIGYLTWTPTVSIPTMSINTPIAAKDITPVRNGGHPPFTYSITNGSLPTGLSLSSAGVVSGTPTVLNSNNGSITVSVTDSTPNTPQTKTGIVNYGPVLQHPPLQFNINTTIPRTNPNSNISPITLRNFVVNAVGDTTFDFANGGTTEDWLTVNPTSSVLTGNTGNNISLGKIYSLRVTDSLGRTAVGSLSMYGVFYLFSYNGETDIPAAKEGQSVSFNVGSRVSGSVAPFTYSLVSNPKTNWLSINASTGLITGVRPSDFTEDVSLQVIVNTTQTSVFYQNGDPQNIYLTVKKNLPNLEFQWVLTDGSIPLIETLIVGSHDKNEVPDPIVLAYGDSSNYVFGGNPPYNFGVYDPPGYENLSPYVLNNNIISGSSGNIDRERKKVQLLVNDSASSPALFAKVFVAEVSDPMNLIGGQEINIEHDGNNGQTEVFEINLANYIEGGIRPYGDAYFSATNWDDITQSYNSSNNVITITLKPGVLAADGWIKVVSKAEDINVLSYDGARSIDVPVSLTYLPYVPPS